MKISIIYRLIIIMVILSILSGCAYINNASSEILEQSNMVEHSSDIITSDISTVTAEIDSNESPEIEETRIINDMFSDMGIYFCCTLREVVDALGGMGDATDTGISGGYNAFRVKWTINDNEYIFDFSNGEFISTNYNEWCDFCSAGEHGKPLDEYEYIFDNIVLYKVFGNGENIVYCPNRVKVDASFFPDYDEFINKYNNGEKIFYGSLADLIDYLDYPERAITEEELLLAHSCAATPIEFVIALGVKPQKYSDYSLIYAGVLPEHYGENYTGMEFWVRIRSDLDEGDYSKTFLNSEIPTKEEYDLMINHLLSLKFDNCSYHYIEKVSN